MTESTKCYKCYNEIAGKGFEPIPLDYEPNDLPLVYPAAFQKDEIRIRLRKQS